MLLFTPITNKYGCGAADKNVSYYKIPLTYSEKPNYWCCYTYYLPTFVSFCVYILTPKYIYEENGENLFVY